VPGESSSSGDQVRTAEVIAALCLATDLGMGLPLEHGLQSTLVAMRLGERLGVDDETASQIYYACLLFYIGCTADAEISAELFEDGALLTHFTPVKFGTTRRDDGRDHESAIRLRQRAADARLAGRDPTAPSRSGL
jgi:hypothetical protein